jgi:hypothetical protein
MTTRRPWIVLAVVALLLVGACGGAAEDPPGDDGPAPTEDAPPDVAPPDDEVPADGGDRSKGFARIELTGEFVESLELAVLPAPLSIYEIDGNDAYVIFTDGANSLYLTISDGVVGPAQLATENGIFTSDENCQGQLDDLSDDLVKGTLTCESAFVMRADGSTTNTGMSITFEGRP